MYSICLFFIMEFVGIGIKAQNLDSILRASLHSELELKITQRETVFYDEEFAILTMRNRVYLSDSNLRNIAFRRNDTLYYPLLKIMRNDTLLDWTANL